MGNTAMPECKVHGDCFANRRGVCTCLKDNDFGGRDCPFYKTADTARKDQHGKKDGGAFHGNRNV